MKHEGVIYANEESQEIESSYVLHGSDKKRGKEK